VLQARPEVGAIFTRPRAPGNAEGSVPGTLSFDIARWNHPRSGDILVSSNWNRDVNDAGFAGKTTDGNVAGHGSSSPYDIHNTLIAAGPDFLGQRSTKQFVARGGGWSGISWGLHPVKRAALPARAALSRPAMQR
jgi:hypothetical protein